MDIPRRTSAPTKHEYPVKRTSIMAGDKDLQFNYSEPTTDDRTPLAPLAVEKRLVRGYLRAMHGAPIAMQLWDGERISVCDGKEEVCVVIRSRRAFWGLLLNPELYFGDAYSRGEIDVEGGLYRMVELAVSHRPDYLSQNGWLMRAFEWLTRGPRSNSLRGSKKNIHHHYDLSNQFYKLWLDREHMQYTCAYYASPDATLEQAQTGKLHHICRKLRLRAGDEVVEAGCGWGGLALFMAREYGVRVRAYNISHEQVVYATQRARELNMSDRVEYVEDDYRNLRGEYDVFVSVGMLEHVGVRNYPGLGRIIDSCLRPGGRGLIHTIGRNRPRQMNRWIERRIFPGAYPPTLRQMGDIFEPYGFSVLDVENLRLHYARTLRHWLQRYEDARNPILQRFDERFLRAWRLYLTGSIAAFQLGELQLFQVLFCRGHNNDIPWTRHYLY